VAQRKVIVVWEEQVDVAVSADRPGAKLGGCLEPQVTGNASEGVEGEDRDAWPRVLTSHLMEAALVLVEQLSFVEERNHWEVTGAGAAGSIVPRFATDRVGSQLDESGVLGIAHGASLVDASECTNVG